MKSVVHRGESGQALVLVAVAIMAMLAMLAITVDLALVVGAQRRFDQNGADAAAMAVGRRLRTVTSIEVDDPFTPAVDVLELLRFDARDEDAYGLARQYAGLQPGDRDSRAVWSSAVPTGKNQNASLTSRTHLAVTLEYWGTREWGATWCYSPTGPRPPRAPEPPTCTLFDPSPGANNQPPYTPLPSPLVPFKVRVTVSSTTDGFFTRAIGARNGVPSPPALADERTAACIPPLSGVKAPNGKQWIWTPLSVPGRITCAQAVVTVSGTPRAVQRGALIPVTTGDCNISTTEHRRLFQLWGSQPETCGHDVTPWQSMLDFTDEAYWCDDPSGGSNSNPDYTYELLLPSRSRPGQHCPLPALGITDEWWRTGFIPDNAPRPNIGRIDADIPYWVAKGFPGKFMTCSDYGQYDETALPWPRCRVGTRDGNRIPTYVGSQLNPDGNMGNNIALAFYCDNSVNGALCPNNSPANSYYFAPGQPEFQQVCDRNKDDIARAYSVGGTTLGCRNVQIVLWNDPEWAVTGLAWSPIKVGGGGPERIRAARILTFRIYCAHDNAGRCVNPPPNNIPGVTGSGKSRVYGRFVSPELEGTPPPGTTPVTIYGNYATFES